MKPLRLYPPVPVEAQDYSKVKKQTVPNQSLTLRDIIKRFIRKESLPIGREGIYNETLGDLEKIAREDLTQRHERAYELKQTIKTAREKYAQHHTPKPAPPTPAPAVIPPEGSKDASSAS